MQKNILLKNFNHLSALEIGRKNNFDFIRFFAASLVIFCHSFPLNNSLAVEPLLKLTNGFCETGHVAVAIFFAASGYLITKSLFQRKDLLVFIEARILRLLPALIVSNIFVALVLGSIVSSIPPTTYLTNPETWAFVLWNSILRNLQFDLPGVFTNNPLPGAVNGSLWTLPVEIKMYMIVFIIGCAGLALRPVRVATIGKFACIVTIFLSWYYSSPYDMHEADSLALLAPFFMLGALAYFYRTHLPISLRIMTCFWIVLPFLNSSFIMKPFFTIVISYSVLVFAYHPWLHKFNNFAKFGDFSYGLYIYAFPIQQTIIHYFPQISISVFCISSFFTTLLFAIASWYLIEKKALSLKGILPFKISGRLVLKPERQ